VTLEIDIAKTLKAGERRFELTARLSSRNGSLVLFGPSGSGKTVTLMAVAGLMAPDAGTIRLDGRVLFAAGPQGGERVDVPARERGVGFVFQDYALFPHLSVAENVGFGLAHGCFGGLCGRLDAAARRHVAELLDLAGLAELADARPGKLSGGQRQRVALIRALARSPRLLLRDEPFTALDPLLRRRMRREVRSICAGLGTPVALITHDPDDVAEFGGTVALYESGSVRGVREFADGPEGGAAAREMLLAEHFGAYA